MKLAGKVALQKSYQALKFWYELLPPLKSYFSFAPNTNRPKFKTVLSPVCYIYIAQVLV